jgi:hypothetical protein
LENLLARQESKMRIKNINDSEVHASDFVTKGAGFPYSLGV